MKITKQTPLREILGKSPELADMFSQSGMGCACCPMATQETLEEGCRAHGMNDKEINKLIVKLNKGERK